MLLLFDYDGVIVDSFDLLLELCSRAQARLGCGRRPEPEDFRTIENLDFRSLAERIGIPPEKIAAYGKHVLGLQQECWSVDLFPGIAEVLPSLARSATLGVISASRSDSVAASLRDFGLDKTMATILGGERDVSKSERIGLARAMFSAARDETFMIGDAISDIRQGKQAGVRTVAVSWGFQERGLLAREGPDRIVDRPEQLLEIVDGSQLPASQTTTTGPGKET